MRERLSTLLERGDYLSYAYSYPHKTAYRPLQPAMDLRAVWARENRSSLFLYLHVPFCEQRCGFCNLFTQVQPKEDVEERYVASLALSAGVMAEVLRPFGVARVAVGGGTPTFLRASRLDRVLEVARSFGAAGVPTSVEVSPTTLDDDKLAVLRAHGVTRVSMGVQSMFPDETASVQRRQSPIEVERALRSLADTIPVRNVDLIYGLLGQTSERLRASIDRVIAQGANELYLYPLYVRPLTILGRRETWADERLALYRSGRDHLSKLGWRQVSMRMFTAPNSPSAEVDARGPVYRCQDDGMIGLGPGARSYASDLHYATPFAVAQSSIRSRIEHWLALPEEEHAVARHGLALDAAEQRRRYLILSLLDGRVERDAYRARFGEDVLSSFPELGEVIEERLATLDEQCIRLSERGLERADVLGHWLQSSAVRAAREAWVAS